MLGFGGRPQRENVIFIILTRLYTVTTTTVDADLNQLRLIVRFQYNNSGGNRKDSTEIISPGSDTCQGQLLTRI